MLVTFPILDAGLRQPVYAQGPRSLEAVRLLRLPVTDRCNLRCVYCMPEDGMRLIEYMLLGNSKLLDRGIDSAQHYIVDNTVVARRIKQAIGPLRPVDRARETGVGPAELSCLEAARGRVGFISAMSQMGG